MFTSGRSYEGMNYQIEVICKINMLIVASDGRGWGRHSQWSHTEMLGDNDVKDDHQIVHEKVRRGGVSLNDKQIPPVELTTCDPPGNK